MTNRQSNEEKKYVEMTERKQMKIADWTSITMIEKEKTKK